MDNLIFAIDPATLAGWAVLTTDGRYVDSGTFNSRGSAANRGESQAVRLLRFRRWFEDRLESFANGELVYVCHEQSLPPMGGRATSWATADMASGIKTIMQVECAERGITIVNVMPTTVKKFATGSGKAKKPEMIAACNEWLSNPENISCSCRRKKREVTDDNESDAIHIARCCLHKYPPMV